jgi:hypothetical protein
VPLSRPWGKDFVVAEMVLNAVPRSLGCNLRTLCIRRRIFQQKIICPSDRTKADGALRRKLVSRGPADADLDTLPDVYDGLLFYLALAPSEYLY